MNRNQVIIAIISLTLSSGHGFAQKENIGDTLIAKGNKQPTFGTSLGKNELKKRSFATGDTATLIKDTDGVSFYTGGGVSSLPVINGLADDRIKITIDNMSITSACPNHMNPALSYVNPHDIEKVDVYAGIVPVSEGGDSIAGTIDVETIKPVFATKQEEVKLFGDAGAFYRSNGNVQGGNTSIGAASDKLSIGYTHNTIDAENYKDGNGDEVAASRYRIHNHGLKLGALSDTGLYTLDIGYQDIPFQGYPNQAMDMTYNKSLSFNAGYENNFSWGELEGNIFNRHVRHKMDLLPDKSSGNMPMDTKANDSGYVIKAAIPVSDANTLRVGNELHLYTLDDWWPPIDKGFMAPNEFWNIRDGKRDRVAVFTQLDSQINQKLSTQVGARLEHVTMNTGDVQGYHDSSDGMMTGGMMGMTPYEDSTYKTDADAFNAKKHRTSDLNLDLTASTRYENSENETYDLGVSRKNRSPNLHERYTWSNEAMMAGLMNNWFGDLNSYVGNIDLKPETAYSIKASADWHDSEQKDWQVKLAPFYSYVQDYINAIPNTSSNPYNMPMISGRRSLVFANEDAILHGIDISGKKHLGELGGSWAIAGNINYTHAKTIDGDYLYNIMPLNGRIALEHQFKDVSNTFEAVFADNKDHLSQVRNEQPTDGYGIFNYRVAYAVTDSVALNAGLDNIFDRQYALPLGGLEYAKAGVPVRAAGRSVNMGLSAKF